MIEKVEQKLKQCGVVYRLGTYSSSAKNALEAAAEMGVEIECIGKSLLFKNDKKFVLFVLPSNAKVNLQRLSEKMKSLTMASVSEIKDVTGHEIGTVTPLDLKTTMPIYLDSSLLMRPEMGISSGQKGTEILLRPQDLVTCVSAEVIDLI